MAQISVIVTVYNTRPYLEKCVESILTQEFDDLEIIMIDNRSTDGSYELLQAYAKKDRRIRLHRREAHGNASSSRDMGLRMATGEFITYVDSDDSIKPGMYEHMMRLLRREQADIAVCNYDMVYADRTDEAYSNMENMVIDVRETGFEAYFLRYFCMSRPNNYIWSRLVRRSLIAEHGITIPHVDITEDTILTMFSTAFAGRVVHIDTAYYLYLQREDSTVRELVRSKDVSQSYIHAFDEVYALAKRIGVLDCFEAILPVYAYTRLRSILFYKGLAGVQTKDDYKGIRESIRGTRIEGYLHKALEGDALKRYAAMHAMPQAEYEGTRSTIQKCLNESGGNYAGL